MRHDVLGLTLHPFDAAANKVLALVGRIEVRDWIDVIECHQRLQPLGYLAWAACGKDAGFSPGTILEEAARSARYSQREVDELVFEGPAPNAGELSRIWHTALAEAREVVRLLPPENIGKCVLAGRDLCRASATDLPALLERGGLSFHEGRVRGAWPSLLPGLTMADLAPPPREPDRGR